MQDIYISIGQNIRRRRKEKLLTQESLAANVETSAQYISRIERGQVCPSLEFLYRLSAALECPIYSLLPSTAPSASTSFFSQELASQLNSCTPQQQQFLMSFISWFLCCFSKRMRKVFRKNEKSMLQNCNKKAKRKGRLQRVKKPM